LLAVEAAFFDLDKTVIAKASIMAFARDFRREGLLTRRTMAKGLWLQLVYVHLGAGSKKLFRIRQSVLAVTRGWDQAQVRQVVGGKLSSAIDPITFAEAKELIDTHRHAGRKVYLVSAAPAEIVEPLAAHLGAHGAVASVAQVGADGRYTGDMERYAYGQEKVALIHHLARRDGLDLAGSFAYSDSATDLPMLEAVGHPAAVNPDRALRRIAQLRGWEILRFEQLLEPALCLEAKADSRGSRVLRRSAAAAVVAAAGGAGAVAWRYRSQHGLRYRGGPFRLGYRSPAGPPFWSPLDLRSRSPFILASRSASSLRTSSPFGPSYRSQFGLRGT
jgi:HAD superfamily hydrolase (TIGR01490 family)